LKQQGSIRDECPYKNITALLTPGESTAEVLLDGYSITFPQGEYQIKREHNSNICIFYVIIKSKYLKNTFIA